jgi:hypothetical protein
MSETARDGVWVNSNLFTENRNRFPAEEYLRYSGQVIAWSVDGTRILASGKDELEVAGKLKQAGIDISRVVFDNVPDTDTIF